jgi:hypothetical protein
LTYGVGKVQAYKAVFGQDLGRPTYEAILENRRIKMDLSSSKRWTVQELAKVLPQDYLEAMVKLRELDVDDNVPDSDTDTMAVVKETPRVPMRSHLGAAMALRKHLTPVVAGVERVQTPPVEGGVDEDVGCIDDKVVGVDEDVRGVFDGAETTFPYKVRNLFPKDGTEVSNLLKTLGETETSIPEERKEDDILSLSPEKCPGTPSSPDEGGQLWSPQSAGEGGRLWSPQWSPQSPGSPFLLKTEPKEIDPLQRPGHDFEARSISVQQAYSKLKAPRM